MWRQVRDFDSSRACVPVNIGQDSRRNCRKFQVGWCNESGETAIYLFPEWISYSRVFSRHLYNTATTSGGSFDTLELQQGRTGVEIYTFVVNLKKSQPICSHTRVNPSFFSLRTSFCFSLVYHFEIFLSTCDKKEFWHGPIFHVLNRLSTLSVFSSHLKELYFRKRVRKTIERSTRLPLLFL